MREDGGQVWVGTGGGGKGLKRPNDLCNLQSTEMRTDPRTQEMTGRDTTQRRAGNNTQQLSEG